MLGRGSAAGERPQRDHPTGKDPGKDPISTGPTEDKEGTLLLPSGPVPIHYQERNGVAVWQGDIDLRIAPQGSGGLQRTQSFAMGNRAAMLGAGALWTNNRVPYRFDPSISLALRTAITRAIKHYNARTALNFTFDATNAAADYLLFSDDDPGCHAGLGRAPGQNTVFVDDAGCEFPQIVHEIGHALGLHHEMSRPDRESFVTIQWSNICSGQKSEPKGQQCNGNDRRGQFLDTVPGETVGDFDFSSLMLYPATVTDKTFALDTSKPIITRRDGSLYANPQTEAGLSAGDLRVLRSIYPITPAREDFNGDGKPDLVWHNAATGETQIWFMGRSSRLGRATVDADRDGGDAKFVGAPWRIAGIDDFNRDGKPDLLWHNELSAETQIWFMDGSSRVGRATVDVARDGGDGQFVGLPWSIVGSADYNHDATPDVLWHNATTGETQVWYMNGSSRIGRATVDANRDGGGHLVGAPWFVVNH